MQPGRGQPLHHPAGRPVLVVAQFRVGMQIPAERDQVRLPGGEELAEFPGQVMAVHPPPPPAGQAGPRRPGWLRRGTGSPCTPRIQSGSPAVRCAPRLGRPPVDNRSCPYEPGPCPPQTDPARISALNCGNHVAWAAAPAWIAPARPAVTRSARTPAWLVRGAPRLSARRV